MERRKAITAAAATALTMLAGAAGIALNSGIVGAGADGNVGQLTPVIASTQPIAPSVGDPTVTASTGDPTVAVQPAPTIAPTITPTQSPPVTTSSASGSDADQDDAEYEDDDENEAEYENEAEQDDDSEYEDDSEQEDEYEDEHEYEYEGNDDDD